MCLMIQAEDTATRVVFSRPKVANFSEDGHAQMLGIFGPLGHLRRPTKRRRWPNSPKVLKAKTWPSSARLAIFGGKSISPQYSAGFGYFPGCSL
jgi:hypothetical protein